MAGNGDDLERWRLDVCGSGGDTYNKSSGGEVRTDPTVGVSLEVVWKLCCVVADGVAGGGVVAGHLSRRRRESERV